MGKIFHMEKSQILAWKFRIEVGWKNVGGTL